MTEHSHDTRPRRPLREVVSNIDRDILHLLLRRHNLLARMHNSKGFLDPAEEKALRESWEAAVSRVSPPLGPLFFIDAGGGVSAPPQRPAR